MTDAGDPAASEGIADQWTLMGSGLRDAGILLQQAVIGSESGWTGQAADAMRYRLRQVADWSMSTGQAFTTASSAVRDQSAAVGEAKTRMPEPVPYDPDRMINDAMRGGLVDIIMLPQRMYEQKQKSDAAYGEAVRVVGDRDDQLATSAAAMPAFSAPPVLSDDGGGRPPEPGGRPPGGDSGPAGGPGYPGSGPVPVPAGGPNPSGPDRAGTTGQTGQGLPDQGLTKADTYTPPTVGQPVVPVGVGPGPNAPSGQGPTVGPYGGFPPGGGFGRGAGAGFDPTRGGGGPAGGGRGAAEGGGAGGSRGGGPGRGLGGGAGMGAGGAAAEAAAGGRGAAGARGGAGMGGLPMGGGRGRGDEDSEHARPAWLLEDDPQSLFGCDEMTAPPVIGE